MTEAEASIGRRFAIDHRYYDWGADLPSAYDRWTAAAGRIPMISICACRFRSGTDVAWSSIASGAEDVYVLTLARQLAAWKVPVFLVLDSEAEDHVGDRGSAQDYRDAWRHVVTVFRGAGADNVAFVWSTTTYALRPEVGRVAEVESMYPGDDVVDWIGADPYNFYASGVWQSFGDSIDAWYRWARKHHPDKPLMLSEWGSKEDPADPGRKAAWMHDAADQLRRRYRAIKAVVYFDEQKHERGTVNDWRIDTSPESLAAFASIAGDDWFAPNR